VPHVTSNYYYAHLTTFFQDNQTKSVPERYNILDFTEAEMMGWEWHQPDHKQVICTSLQTDNHSNTPS